MKSFFDIFFSVFGLIVSFPFLIPLLLLIFIIDFKNPFFLAERVGKNGKIFKLWKLRTMVVNAYKIGIDSTSASDSRILKIGKLNFGYYIRKFKLDEFPQLWNVLKNDISIVGPRPNVISETDIYTVIEKDLLSVKPGLTDISSIVFSDLAEILKNSKNPNLDYNQLVRPWKSRLGLLYIKNKTFLLDLKLIYLTFLNFLSREKALQKVSVLLEKINAPDEVIEVSKRKSILSPYPPPGSKHIVRNR